MRPDRFPLRTVGSLFALLAIASGVAVAQTAVVPLPAQSMRTIGPPASTPTRPTLAVTPPLPAPQVAPLLRFETPGAANPPVVRIQSGAPAPSTAQSVAPTAGPTVRIELGPAGGQTLQAAPTLPTPQGPTAQSAPPASVQAPPAAPTLAAPTVTGPQAAPPVPAPQTLQAAPTLPTPGGQNGGQAVQVTVPQGPQAAPALPTPQVAPNAQTGGAGPQVPVPPRPIPQPAPTLVAPQGTPPADAASGQGTATLAGPQSTPAPSTGPTLRVPAPSGTANAVPQLAPPTAGQSPTLPVPVPSTTARPAAAPAEPATAAAAETAPADPASSPFSPDADVLIETEILPVLDLFVGRTKALQNAVLRHCMVQRSLTRAALEPAFVVAIEASTALLPLSFGSPEAISAPRRLLTRATSTAFSSARLEAVMEGEGPVPRSLAALREGEEEALIGLPALEHLLMRPRYSSALRLQDRCAVAVPIAANIVDTAVRVRQRWLNRDVDVHWQGDDAELAGRLRLRDLIQGAINAVDRVSLDLSEFQRQPRDNNAARFAQVRHGLPYLISAIGALRSHIKRLEKFVAPASRTASLLQDIDKALSVAHARLLALTEGADNDGGYLVAFEQAHGDITDELPSAFGFDATAFGRTLTPFEVTRTGETQTQTPTQSP